MDVSNQTLIDYESGGVETDPSKAYYCHLCKNIITYEHEEITIAESHTHHCANRHGLEFQIACFANAEGCIETGAAYLQDTWFPGYSWQISHCKNCSEHLGWFFRNDNTFYGLILNKLIRQ